MPPEASPRVAWLFPSLALGNYWHPVLKGFSVTYPETTIFTGLWPGYSPGFEGSFRVELVGRMQFVDTTRAAERYDHGFIYVSPAILLRLARFRPQVIFTTAFSLWTLLVVLAKPLGRWRIVITYDGSSPTVDRRQSRLHLLARRFMARFADGFITNSQAGKAYLTEVLQAPAQRVFARPYQVPTASALLGQSAETPLAGHRRPIFLTIGQIIWRKGIHTLLQACALLGEQDYTLLIVGEGEQRAALQAEADRLGLGDRVQWVGWVPYGRLGQYFRLADVFVFPTLEDIWGMVALEAMVFGKPLLCSQKAGVSELIRHQENGYLFDPQKPEQLAAAMAEIIQHPERLASLGINAQRTIAPHTPEAAAQFLTQVTATVLGQTPLPSLDQPQQIP